MTQKWNIIGDLKSPVASVNFDTIFSKTTVTLKRQPHWCPYQMSQKRHKKSTEIGFYIFACYFYRINDEYVLKYTICRHLWYQKNTIWSLLYLLQRKKLRYWLESLDIIICVWDYISYCISLSPPNYFEAVLANNSTRAIFIQYVSLHFVGYDIAYRRV